LLNVLGDYFICDEKSVKLATNVPKDGQRIAVIVPSKIVKLTVTRTKWPCRGTIQRTTAL